MTARQFLKLFGLKGGPFLRSQKTAPRAAAYFDYFESVDWSEAVQEFHAILKREGGSKAPLYYIEGVRRRIMERRHRQVKAERIPAAALEQMIGDILKVWTPEGSSNGTEKRSRDLRQGNI